VLSSLRSGLRCRKGLWVLSSLRSGLCGCGWITPLAALWTPLPQGAVCDWITPLVALWTRLPEGAACDGVTPLVAPWTRLPEGAACTELAAIWTRLRLCWDYPAR